MKGEPDLTLDRTVGADGNISFPLIGSVPVSGLTLREAAKTIGKMLDDGYLRNPLVQVNFVGIGKSAETKPQNIVAEPLKIPSDEIAFDPVPVPVMTRTESKRPLRIEILDGKTGEPVRNAAMLLGGKIYQSSRSGQMTLETDEGPMILLADGYRAVQGNIENHLRKGSRPQIVMDKIPLAKEILVKVVDFASNFPLADVNVFMNGMKVKTNSQGTFKIKEILNEFGEIQLSKKGYRLLRRVLDFKDPSDRIIPLIRND